MALCDFCRGSYSEGRGIRNHQNNCGAKKLRLAHSTAQAVAQENARIAAEAEAAAASAALAAAQQNYLDKADDADEEEDEKLDSDVSDSEDEESEEAAGDAAQPAVGSQNDEEIIDSTGYDEL
ncbi:hypothetical protein DFH09DRAFT_1316483 [Mycena vulgaris]|nr:hypothetical protein DFH09DRAFT_1316483 [Mycena vulgaris]